MVSEHDRQLVGLFPNLQLELITNLSFLQITVSKLGMIYQVTLKMPLPKKPSCVFLNN